MMKGFQMWQGYLKKKDNGVHTIYFDAFANEATYRSSRCLLLSIFALLKLFI